MIIFTIKLLHFSRNLFTFNQSINNEYMNGVYKTNIYGLHSSLWVKTSGPSVTAPLSKIAQLQSPRAHSFNQSLSWPYIFVYYVSLCFQFCQSHYETKILHTNILILWHWPQNDGMIEKLHPDFTENYYLK